MSKKYAVRFISYPNNEEGIDTSKPTPVIKQIFDTKAEAEQELQTLLVTTFHNYAEDEDSLRHFDIFNEDSYGDFSDRIEKIEQFYQEKTGEDFTDISEITSLDLSDGDIVKFVNSAGINEFDMVELDENDEFYAIWLPKKQGYITMFFENMIMLFNNADLPINDDQDLKGGIASELEENAPNDELIDDLHDWLMSNSTKIIDLENDSWFEVRKISVAELQKLQRAE